MAGPYPVSGDQYRTVDRKFTELKRQLGIKAGCPIDPVWLAEAIQALIEQRPVVNPADEAMPQSLLDTSFLFINRKNTDEPHGFVYNSNATEALGRHNIETIRHLAYYTKSELKMLPGVGRTTIDFAEKWCRVAGFELGELSDEVDRSISGVPIPVVLSIAQRDVSRRNSCASQLVIILDLGEDLSRIYSLNDEACRAELKAKHSAGYLYQSERNAAIEKLTEFFAGYDLVWPRPAVEFSI